MNITKIWLEDMQWTTLTQYVDGWWDLMDTVMDL
jgi:hypothetical protein